MGMAGRSGAFYLKTVRTGNREQQERENNRSLFVRMPECEREGVLKTLTETKDSGERAMEQEHRER